MFTFTTCSMSLAIGQTATLFRFAIDTYHGVPDSKIIKNGTAISNLCTGPELHPIVWLWICDHYLIILTSVIHSSEPPQVHIATTAGVVVAAMVVILLCIGVTIVVCLKIRKQHARKFDLNRYATVASYSLSLWTTPSEPNITESNFSYCISLISSRPWI